MVQPQNLIPKTVILTGPTAVGKSSVAHHFALDAQKLRANQIEIINADSVCFYQEFNIGSAKPSPEEMNQIPHHLINVATPNENFHAGKFLKDCEQALSEIHARGNRAIIVGGSGFYLKALRLGLWDAPEASPDLRRELELHTNEILYEKLLPQDELHAKKVGPADRYRLIRALEIITLSGKTPSELESAMNKEPDPRFELWVLDRSKEELEQRILERIKLMLDAGFVDEVKSLRAKYPDSKTLHVVGYQQVLNFLDGVKPEGRLLKPGTEGLIDEISLAHRQLAKHQRTWFKNLNPNYTFVLERDSASLQEKLISLY